MWTVFSDPIKVSSAQVNIMSVVVQLLFLFLLLESFVLLLCTIGLENSRDFFIQSELKPSLLELRSHTVFPLRFSYMSLINSSFDWLIGLFIGLLF